MNFEVESIFKSCAYISRPLFSGNGKKEISAAERINSFYGDIIETAVKLSEEKGLKCYIDITAVQDGCDCIIIMKISFRRRGRSVASVSERLIWNNGVIKKRKKQRG